MNIPLIQAALSAFRKQRSEIDNYIAQLEQELTGEPPTQAKRGRPSKTLDQANPQPIPAPRSHHKQRTMSAAGRDRIRQATKARWAKFRAEKEGQEKKLARLAKKKTAPTAV